MFADGSHVLGYLTLKAEGIWTTGLPQYDPPAYIPVVELACLGRDLDQRGEGIGELLLIEALRRTALAAEHIGIAGIYLWATREGAELYESYGFRRFQGDEHRMFLSIEQARAVTALL